MKPKRVKRVQKNKFSFVCTEVLPDDNQPNKPKRAVKIFRITTLLSVVIFWA
jgi:hypothetical protein